MRFGPFSETHLNQIREVLDREKIHYEVDVSLEALTEWRNKRKEHHPHAYPTFTGLVEGAFLEIADQDLTKLDNKLLDFGIFEPQERPAELDAFEDFVCPKCDYAGHATQLCPKHWTPLVTFSQKVSAQKTIQGVREKVITWIAILFAALFFGANYCSHQPSGTHVRWPWQTEFLINQKN